MLSTIAAASRELGVSSEHIRRKIRRGEWPFYKFGERVTRVDVEEIKHLGHLIAERRRVRSSRSYLEPLVKSGAPAPGREKILAHN